MSADEHHPDEYYDSAEAPLLDESSRRRRQHDQDITTPSKPAPPPPTSPIKTRRNAARMTADDRGFYAIIVVVAFVQGASHLSNLARDYLFKDDLHFSPAQLAVASGIITSPWVIKPLYGFISDSYPIGGYRRAPYFFLFGLFGGLCYLVMGLVSLRYTFSAELTLTLASMSVAFVNVLAEALIVERGRHAGDDDDDDDIADPQTVVYESNDAGVDTTSKKLEYDDNDNDGDVGDDDTAAAAVDASYVAEAPNIEAAALIKHRISALMTVYWGVESIGKISTGFASGWLLTTVPKGVIFGLTGLFPLLLCVLSLFVHEDEVDPHAKLTFTSQWRLLSKQVRQPQIWRPLLFMFLWVATPTAQAAYFFFLTNHLGLKPSFIGTLKAVEGLSSVCGLVAWHAWFKHYSYRTVLIVAVLVAAVAGCSPLLLVTGVNRTMGIPDKWFTVGDQALLVGVAQLGLMPLLILGGQTAARVPQIEGTLYALLMSTLNIGEILSYHLGGLLTFTLGISATDFHQLWLLIVICQVVSLLPLLLLGLVPTAESLAESARIAKQHVLADKRNVAAAAAAAAAEAAEVGEAAEAESGTVGASSSTLDSAD